MTERCSHVRNWEKPSTVGPWMIEMSEQCPSDAACFRNGVAFCEVHDPEGDDDD